MTRRENQETQDNIPTQPLPPPMQATPPSSIGKKTLFTPKPVDAQSVLKRLQSELMALMMSGDPGISAFPDGDNIFCWKGTTIGSKDTAYKDIEYKLSLSFTADYPFKPPRGEVCDHVLSS
ncbi:Ubiquitin-conjugating enzyme E2 20 [Acorus calamus]|uniref:Ubiquitin-conjugating enzyme E2 20 n=1 Tax=Acorus calamus TaxID=4465 RepID=A0AAV9CX94_ACOCL|nr:Ubiquitin-conjugating enzyme E2 20 [Acorus calamus]